jgi:hypothetical protein
MGFLGKPRTARWAVPLLRPVSSQIAAQERPALRRLAILEPSTLTRGLPSRFPRDFAKAIPDRTRSLINSRSNSAMEAKIPKTSLPFGVEVSTPSWRLMKSIPSERNSSSALTNWRRLRANRSNKAAPFQSLYCSRRTMAQRQEPGD